MPLDRRAFLVTTSALAINTAVGCSRGSSSELLNVSYDATRELYAAINKAFALVQRPTGTPKPEVNQSHGGSGKQGRSVLEGLKADVVSLALAYDIDQLVTAGLVSDNWRTRLPNNSCPFTSTIAFLVRAKNPKGIYSWDDLAKDGVEVITPNPKSSGGARWNYLAIWGFELGRSKDQARAAQLVKRIFQNVPVLDSGARGAATTFVARAIGDVLLTWESEALFFANEVGKGQFEVVVPPVSILAEPPVSIVDKVVDQQKKRALAEEYLNFLYEPVAQDLAAKHYYRPNHLAKNAMAGPLFAELELFKLTDRFGSWSEAHNKHFTDGGTFDQIYQPA